MSSTLIVTSLNSQHQSAFSRTLRVPELCRIVCSFLDKTHYAKLLYLSRSIYDCTLPIVWEDVDFRSILLLIPGATVTGSEPVNRLVLDYVFTFHEAIDLYRFNVHAPFVRTVRTASSYIIQFPRRWPKPGETPTESNSLLPNLRHIIINSFSLAKPEYVNWVPRLLHPDLLGFEMYSLSAEHSPLTAREAHSWLDQETSSNLVDQLSCICPRLETLRLYPAQEEPNEVQPTAMYNNIASLTHLRSFTFGGATVHEELFQILGQLPHLETLSLRADESQVQGDSKDPINVPNDSFLSLRHLILYQLNESAMSRICNVPPLFRCLVSASIIFEGKPTLFGRAAITINRSDVAVTCLGVNSPHIERLTILPDGDCESQLDLSRIVIDAFKIMPLRYLRVGTIDPDSRWPSRNHHPEITWEHFLAAVPQLEELHMETKKIKLTELQLLGSWLPKLRLLVFWQADLRETEPLTQAVNATQSIIIRCWSYFGSELSGGFRYGTWVPHPPNESDVLNAARCLHGVWPNATCETHIVGYWPSRSWPNEEAGEKLKEVMALLNSEARQI